MRAAIYYAPAADDPLWLAGCQWLGRDPESTKDCAQPDVAGLHDATCSPRRYGFHATLKPPITLAHGLDRFIDDLRAVVSHVRPFAAPTLAVARIDGFVALVEATPSARLRAIADRCVIEMDHHRVPETPDQIARRSVGLDPTATTYLTRFGYPYVLDKWRFHMTLTERLPACDPIEAAARRHFTACCAMERSIDGLAVYVEQEPGAAFDVVARVAFGG
jgi:hypothetical protein